MQVLPSLHAVPLVATGFEHTPVEVLQVPTVWQASSALQVFGFEPTHEPLWQLSLWVQALPSLHAVPFVATGFEHTPVEVLQVPTVWQASSALQVFGFEPTQEPL